MMVESKFFYLLRYSLGIEDSFVLYLSADEWAVFFHIAQVQSLLGVLYQAILKLPKEQKPPTSILLQWSALAEVIKSQNKLQKDEVVRLTTFFESKGHRTAILKGQANALLYPNPLSRQVGDIDIYVDGGLKRIQNTLFDNHFFEDASLFSNKRIIHPMIISRHHLHIHTLDNKSDIEIHFLPSSGSFNPFANHYLQSFLNQEINTTFLVPEGFRVPTISFALVMQLSHIQKHFYSGGIGLRQICDYYFILKHSSIKDRATTSVLLNHCCLNKTAGALMWLMRYVFNMDESCLFCKTDIRRGLWMLKDIMAGGNFGLYNKYNQSAPINHFLQVRMRQLRLLFFDFRETVWMKVKYWIETIKRLCIGTV